MANESAPWMTEAQIERLAFLVEELGEATQAAGKTLRHGLDSSNPLSLGSRANREWLEEELGNVLAAVELLTAAGEIDAEHVQEHKAAKLVAVRRWMHHQER